MPCRRSKWNNGPRREASVLLSFLGLTRLRCRSSVFGSLFLFGGLLLRRLVVRSCLSCLLVLTEVSVELRVQGFFGPVCSPSGRFLAIAGGLATAEVVVELVVQRGLRRVCTASAGLGCRRLPKERIELCVQGFLRWQRLSTALTAGFAAPRAVVVRPRLLVRGPLVVAPTALVAPSAAAALIFAPRASRAAPTPIAATSAAAPVVPRSLASP
mmetsp:Transcript_23629/g.67765  ORF Transcript_23629/g.67765 Transcript_23629/m.67765 type:complete len:213 (+) Transcript_23629:97-735(+)